ncbi:hypothetical protein CC85DRAFT_81094 [Cutaneotrichosporon oleaginosum]|uniref:Uncharacterized protein n=1 Tax=Cutaneotrichosporon oleaginosum TaxID=879819 RepID=A0A0J0XNI9_9TREE|nr:uncharacterized protein CC85DRAFT_81094 [Cutaneotrichosporon oleaginosum]KLT42643.1 hypothetical protein CC85DRAFT_81094 [Cutaneotrichosporon oleaginosum]TXT05240.1 hypothetical protein COLE_06560 [Cutaneotrichosporon oleaginosum]
MAVARAPAQTSVRSGWWPRHGFVPNTPLAAVRGNRPIASVTLRGLSAMSQSLAAEAASDVGAGDRSYGL